MLDLNIGYLSHKIMLIILIVLNECLNLISINFNWSPKSWSIMQQEISRAKLHKTLLTKSIHHSTFFIHCTIHFVCVCVCVFRLHFIFLEIIKHNMPKMFLLLYSLLKLLHKNSHILNF